MKMSKKKHMRFANLNLNFQSENRQFAVVLVMGIIFSCVLVFVLWLQSQRIRKPLETYVMDSSVPSFEIKLVSNGVVDSGVSMDIQVAFFDIEKQEIEVDDSFNFISDSDGVLVSESLNFEQLIVGRKYNVLIKGPVHRQLKFENIEFHSGVINLTERALQPGDLPWENGLQDKVINEDDYNSLIKRIGSTDENDLVVADLDFNGVINEVDRSLLLSTLVNYEKK